MKKTLRRVITGVAACSLVLSMGFTAMAAEDAIVIPSEEAVSTVNGLADGLCSWTSGGQDATTLVGDDYAFVPVVYVENGVYDAEKSLAGDAEGITDTELTGLDIQIEMDGLNGVILYNSDYTIKDSVIALNAAAADGSTTCDFSGKGAAVATYGEGTNLVIDSSVITADGVAGLTIFCDNGSSVLVNNSVLYSDGGTMYEGYINSPDQKTMVAPPWILGIMGTSRCTNLEGKNSTMTVVDSATSSARWAVLSTDSGSNMYLNVVNSSLTLTGSEEDMQADGKFNVENPYTTRPGYGTYTIGSAVETFLGAQLSVGTMANIFTGGTAYYGNLVAGESYELLKADGSVHYTYEATEDVQTVINSDTFGFMAHQGNNTVTIDGAQVNSEFTGFVMKSGNNTAILVENGAEINAANGILLQLFDNDDSTTSFDGANMAFGEYHEEYEGFPTEAAVEAGSAANTSSYTIVDSDLEGAIFNGIGWNANELSEGNVKSMTLNVNLEGTATLAGQIASTSCIHATYEGQTYLKENDIQAFEDAEEAAAFAADYQATYFTQAEYFDINQVANLIAFNGANIINVCVVDDAVWTVTDTSLIQSLAIDGNGQVIVAEGVVLTVGEEEYEAGTYTAADFAAVAAEEAGESEGAAAEEAASEGGESEGEAAEEAASEGESAAEEAPAEEAPAAAGDTSLEAYKAYMHAFLDAEELLNATMQSDGSKAEFEACIDNNDYETFPGDMFFSGMLESGVAMTYDEFVAAGGAATEAAAAEEGAADPTSREAYHEYLYKWLDNELANNSSMTEDNLPEFYACIDADDYETFPGDMLFGGMLETGVAMTYDEFVAAGGEYTIG